METRSNIFYIYFQKLNKSILRKKEFHSFLSMLDIVIIIIKIMNIYQSNYNAHLDKVYKELSPVYYICTNRFVNPILSIYYFINDYIKNDNIEDIDIIINIFNFLIFIFYILGSIVYLEFIELNFCNFNFYTRRNIRERAIEDVLLPSREFTLSFDDITNENENAE